jgi:hypothetical protein
MTTQTPQTAYHFTARDLTWSAPSDRGVATYTVRASAFDGELRCSCPARVTCKHIRRALAGELGKPRCKVTQEPKRERPVLTVAGGGFGFVTPSYPS